MDVAQFQFSSEANQQVYFYQSTELRIEVLQNQHHIWMEINGVIQSACQNKAPYRPVLPHILAMFLPYNHHKIPSSVLELGGGGQSVQRYFAQTQASVEFTSIEYDQDVIDTVKNYMPGGDDLNIIKADAFEFIAQALNDKLQYDWVVVDLFHGAESPTKVFSSEFFLDCYKITKQDGWLVFNCLRSEPEILTSLVETVNECFDTKSKLFAVPGMKNHILLAYKSPELQGALMEHIETFNFPDEIEIHNLAKSI